MNARAEALLGALDPEQRAAVLAPGGALLIHAGAGTGKTRTLTHRIAYRIAVGEATPGTVLAVTHSAKAAGEMRDRLMQVGGRSCGAVSVRTFHAAALRQLRYFWGASGGSGRLNVLESRYSAVRSALRQTDRAEPTSAAVLDTTSEIGWAKAQMLTPASYIKAANKAGRLPSTGLERTRDAWKIYEELKQNAGQIDFEDMLLLTAHMIENDHAVAETIRRGYQSFYVDEYQDIDPLQQRVLDAWLGPDNLDVTVAGDHRQTIYSFRGSDRSFIDGFSKRYGGAMVVNLVRDYRSTPQIVEPANTLTQAGASEALIGMRSDGPRPVAHEASTENDEAAWVAREVTAAIRGGTSPGEIAILYRFNAQSASFEQALAGAGVSYVVSDTEKFFDRPEIKFMIAAFAERAALAPESLEATGEVVGSSNPYQAVELDADPFAAETDPYESESVVGSRNVLAGSGLDVLRGVLEDAGWSAENPPVGAGAARDRWEAVAALLTLVEALPEIETTTARELLSELERRRAESHEVASETVSLSTIHRAKGLEWDTVFLTRMTEGSLPSSYAKTDAEIQEERRLAYVGITRAKRLLHLSWSATRDGRIPSKPSRFLAETGLVAPAEVRTRSRSGSSPKRGAPRLESGSKHTCESCGKSLTHQGADVLTRCDKHLDGPAKMVFLRLKEWRKETSSITRAPAFTVLSDAALMSIVALNPKNPLELAKISGIGEIKRKKYGEAILAITAEL